MIKKFDTVSEYTAAGTPTESRAAMVVENDKVYYDGINIMTDDPVMGDAVYGKGGKVYYFKGGKDLDHAKLISAGYTDLGQIIGRRDGKAIYLDKDISSAKYLDVAQYAITGISSTNITVYLKMSPNYESDTPVNISLSDTSISQANATAISNAVAAKAREVGDTKDWWAYLDSANNRIIIQCDTCEYYTFYSVWASGCSIYHITWEDMPENSYYFKSNGRTTRWLGAMNIARYNAYWSVNGRSNIESTDVWHGNIGTDTDPLTASAFRSTSMYGTGKHQYATYEDYIRGEFGIMDNQKFAAFNLPSAKELGEKYGNKTAPTKNGGTKYKFPALHYPRVIDRGVEGLRAGDIYLTGIDDGCIFMKDENMEIINATRQKMGHSLISNGSYRWFSQRWGVGHAWLFNGHSGTLGYYGVHNGFQVQGSALLNLKY